MSFAELETCLWLVFAWFTIQTYGLAYFSVGTLLYFFLFGKFIKKDYTTSFLKIFL